MVIFTQLHLVVESGEYIPILADIVCYVKNTQELPGDFKAVDDENLLKMIDVVLIDVILQVFIVEGPCP